MDVPSVVAAAAKPQSVAPRVVPLSPGRRLLGIWSNLADDFILEFSGERMAVWTTRAGCHGGGLDVADLKRVFKASHYAFQPITVVLHPPTVCIKTFSLGGMSASDWLTQHLHDVFPPGDRRQMRMVNAVVSQDQLLVAVVNRGALCNISQMIWQAGGSIKMIVPAAAIDLSSRVIGDGDSFASDWMLTRYKYEQGGDTLSVWSSCATEAKTRSFGIAISHSHSVDYLPQQLDLLPQLKVTQPLPTQLVARIFRSSLAAATILLLLATILYLSGSIFRSANAIDQEALALSNRVTALQEQNRELRQQLDRLKPSQFGHAVVGVLLYAMAAATPDDAWLQRLELQRMSEDQTYEFRMSGLSRSEKSPATFASALADNPLVEEAHLSRVGKTDDSVRDRFGRNIAGKVTEFDLQGRTRTNDSN